MFRQNVRRASCLNPEKSKDSLIIRLIGFSYEFETINRFRLYVRQPSCLAEHETTLMFHIRGNPHVSRT